MHLNPPLEAINPEDLMTVKQAAEWLRVGESTIRLWVHRGKLTHVDLPGGGPLLYHRRVLADVEYETWLNGADRPLRGGRKRDLERQAA